MANSAKDRQTWGFHCPVVPYQALPFPSLMCGARPPPELPRPQPRLCRASPLQVRPARGAISATAELPLPSRLSASTLPAKLWRLVNSPRVRSVRWDSRAQGLLVDRWLFQRELLSLSNACQAAPYSLQATQFRSFVLQLHRYSFQGAGLGWLSCARQCWGLAPLRHRRDRPNLLARIKRWSAANRQQLAAGREGYSRFQQLHTERCCPLPHRAAAINRHPRHFSPQHSSWQCRLCSMDSPQLAVEYSWGRGIATAGSGHGA
ncbi:LOW QUALITY PROTEIN: heat shock factor protein 5-like [Zonotrichia albicollis]|uniref:LOW QUALITY PROTEIN: heat shock factor protein 5-like n=1 Tax=Zonotrichia albicollis TaxID=44394 RepID=UPI003D80ED73